MQHTEAKIALYRTSFDELKRVSGIDDLKEIVHKYVKSEEETFSLFNYVQAQNQETDWTLERHTRLEEEIKSYEEKLSDEEAQRAEAMADLQGKWRNAKGGQTFAFLISSRRRRCIFPTISVVSR